MWWLLVSPCRFRSRRAMSDRPLSTERTGRKSPQRRRLTIVGLLLGQRPLGSPARDRPPGLTEGPLHPVADQRRASSPGHVAASVYTHLRAHETRHDLVCRLLLEKKKKNTKI